MSGFVTDFFRNGGTYMIINAEGGLHSDHLNRIQRNMLASVTIPNLLRLDIREIDFEVTLHYEITGKRMLSQCLKSDWMTMTEFYSLLLQIVKVLDSSKEYMLTDGNYLLDEEHIFVEEPLSSGTVYLTYLPLLDISSEQSISQSLLTLVNRLMTRVTDMEGSGIQKIIGLCGGELFSVAGLKKLLTSLLLDEATVAPQLTENSLNHLNLPLADYPQNPSRMNFTFDPASLGDRSFGEEEDDACPGEPEISRTEIKPTYLWLGAALLGALVWKFAYWDRPTNVGLYISIGISAALILIVLFINSGRIDLGRFFRSDSSLKRSEDENQDHEERKVHFDGKGDIDREGKIGSTYHGKLHRYEEKWRWNEGSEALGLSSTSAKQAGGNMAPIAVESPISDPVQIPLLPSMSNRASAEPAPATVLLKDLSGADQLKTGNVVHYLERKPNSGMGAERIPLPKGSFIIGRSEDLAQYVEKEAGVSRAHVELMIRENGCCIKDLGSRNGTKLNGELLAPYKDYPLEPGESFSIAEITFQLGRNI